MQNIEHDSEFYIREAYRIRSQFVAGALKSLVNALKKPFSNQANLATKADVVELKKASPASTAQKAA